MSDSAFLWGMVPLNISHSFLSTIHPLPFSFLSPLCAPFSFCVSPLTMLPKFINISPFKVEHQQELKHVNKRRKHEKSFESSSVGLRLLPQITTTSNNTSNVLFKSAMRKPNQYSIPHDFCFLKTCNLCNKHLSPDKDIYMYRYINRCKIHLINRFCEVELCMVSETWV